MQRGAVSLPAVYEYNNVRYPRASILAAIAKEDGEAVADGDSTEVSSGSGEDGSALTAGASPAATSDGQASRCTVIAGGDRKTRHCLFRLVGILIMDDVRPLFMESRTQLVRKELDEGQAGYRREVWSVIRKKFIDPAQKVSPHECVPGSWCAYLSAGSQRSTALRLSLSVESVLSRLLCFQRDRAEPCIHVVEFRGRAGAPLARV